MTDAALITALHDTWIDRDNAYWQRVREELDAIKQAPLDCIEHYKAKRAKEWDE